MDKRYLGLFRVLTGAALFWSLAVSANAQVASGAAETEEEVKKVTVTGSRIRRIDVETPSPVVVITREDLDATGFSTVGDALRALPQNTGQSLSSVDGGTSFTPGTSSINLRGLGNNNTLALINGRRAAPYGSPGFNGFQVVFDYNSVPAAAIESIQIVKDGASAIYGSDAVAGVVNVQLRRDFEGMNSQVSFGDYFDTGGFEKKIFGIFGTTSGKTSIVASFDWSEQAAVYARDLEYTSTANGASVGGFDQRSSANVAANVRGLPASLGFGSQASLRRVDSLGRPIPLPLGQIPTLADFESGNKFYDFQEDAGMFPETRFWGFYTTVEHDISDTLTAFLDASFRRAEVTIDAAPTPAFFINEVGDSSFGTIVFPATNPYNPFGVDLVDVRWRMRETGNRVNNVTSDYPRIVAGLKGDIGFSWNWEVAALYGKGTTSNTNAGSVADRLLQDALNGVDIDGVTRYANPFGINDPLILEYMTLENPNNDEYELRSFDFSANGDVMDLPAGPLALAFGGEYREEEIASVGTYLNETSGIVGGSSGTNTFGQRDVKSVYAEVSIPVIASVEVQAAVRYEDYSDFGNTTKPKVAAKYRPTDWLLLRASFSQSFRAPDLPYIYATQSTSFTSNFIPDPRRPADPPNQVRQISGGSFDLTPEETDTYYVGAIFEPGSLVAALEDFAFSFEYFQFDQTNLIDSLSAAQILDQEAQFPDLVVRNPPGPGETVGTISFVKTNFQNLGNATYKGFDMSIRWSHDYENIGNFRAEVAATNTQAYEIDGFENVGTYSLPRWRGTGTLAWTRGDWAASMFIYYIGSYETLFDLGKVDAQINVNPQVTYKGWYDTDITVGISNVFNDDPPVDPSDTTLTNPSLHNIAPAMWYMRVGRDF